MQISPTSNIRKLTAAKHLKRYSRAQKQWHTH